MKLSLRDSNLLTLLALILGSACGLVIHQTGASAATVVDLAGAVGTLSTNMVRMVIIPLLFTMLVVATSPRNARGIGRLLGLSLLTFAGLLALGAVFALITTPPILKGIPPPSMPVSEASVRAATQDSELAGAKSGKQRQQSGWKSVGELMPSNLVRAAANEELLPLVLFAILLGLATSKLTDDLRGPLIQFFEGSASVLRILTLWVLRFLPVGIFCIALSTTAVTGWEMLGIVGYWIALVCFVLTLFILLLYAVAAVVGGVSPKDFAKSVIEAQMVAFATRSSIAALPALFRGAETHLPKSRHVADMVLALSAGGFKLNRAVSSIARLLFLTHLYGMTLSAGTLLVFIFTSLLTNLATPGVPSQGGAPTMPLYLAAGIPIEGVILLGSVDAIPDFFMTTLNVTGDMTAVTIVARLAGADKYKPLETV